MDENVENEFSTTETFVQDADGGDKEISQKLEQEKEGIVTDVVPMDIDDDLESFLKEAVKESTDLVNEAVVELKFPSSKNLVEEMDLGVQINDGSIKKSVSDVAEEFGSKDLVISLDADEDIDLNSQENPNLKQTRVEKVIDLIGAEKSLVNDSAEKLELDKDSDLLLSDENLSPTNPGKTAERESAQINGPPENDAEDTSKIEDNVKKVDSILLDEVPSLRNDQDVTTTKEEKSNPQAEKSPLPTSKDNSDNIVDLTSLDEIFGANSHEDNIIDDEQATEVNKTQITDAVESADNKDDDVMEVDLTSLDEDLSVINNKEPTQTGKEDSHEITAAENSSNIEDIVMKVDLELSNKISSSCNDQDKKAIEKQSEDTKNSSKLSDNPKYESDNQDEVIEIDDNEISSQEPAKDVPPQDVSDTNKQEGQPDDTPRNEKLDEPIEIEDNEDEQESISGQNVTSEAVHSKKAEQITNTESKVTVNIEKSTECQIESNLIESKKSDVEKQSENDEKATTSADNGATDDLELTPIGVRNDDEEEEMGLDPDETNPNSPTVIELFDDEDENIEADEETHVESTSKELPKGDDKIDSKTDSKDDAYPVFHGKECINFECEKKSAVFTKAPLFVLNFYKIPRKTNKIQFVCNDCFDKSVTKYEELCGSLMDHQPLLLQDIPKRHDFVEILDSSDEEGGKDDTESKGEDILDKDTLNLLQNELDNTISEVLGRVNIENQLSWNQTILRNKLKRMEEDSMEISRELKSLQKTADRMHNSLYQCPKIKIKELVPVDLNTNRAFANETEYSIPPVGEIKFPPIEINGTYYAVKNKAIASWLPCQVTEFMESVASGQKAIKYYKVKFIRIKIPTVKFVAAKHMAYGEPPKVRLQIGARVIALFDAATLTRAKDKPITTVRSAFYPGVVAEQLQVYNRYRYLIFFDDGYAQYVQHKDVRVVCHVSEHVWEDVHPASREFIHNYLTQYQKHRPMVQVKKGQSMITESNGKWLYAKVVDVDASLVQMHFDEQNRSEWIYRGSTRLGPLFREKQTKKTTQISQIPRRCEPYIRYMQDDDVNKGDAIPQTGDKTGQGRAVAKKSVSRQDSQQSMPVKHLNNSTIFLEDDNKPKGKVVYYTAKKNLPPKSYTFHECTPKCLFPVTHNLSSYSPLAKPLLSGWERQIFKSKMRKAVIYRAPCGKRLRNMDELHRYLRATKNILNVDNFDFDCIIHCLAEYIIESSIVQKADLSDGVENMIIPCINYYDNTMPPECSYAAHRIPTQGVNLNLDPEFLVGCDCEDDCLDKSKCSCWQLTLAGVRFYNPNIPLDNIGYHYKRLLEPVQTGIYECNSRCKCSKSCLNRVVQHPLQTKLQVFKTSNRGWGLRCLNDVPKGSFICIYAGLLLTEQNANEGGANFGDEYFAELDYIEVVERLKEGYESDAQDGESDEEVEEPVAENDSDEDFHSTAVVNKNSTVNTRLRARRSTKDYSDSKKGSDTDNESSEKGESSKSGKGSVDDDDEESNKDGHSQERQVINFEPNTSLDNEEQTAPKYKSIRKYYGKNEYCYIMDAKKTGNIGRYFNHSCAPNLFVQNVFVDTHDLRFPWVAFFALSHIRAGTELTWNYNYEVGIVPGKVLYCQCGAPNCRGRLL